MLSCSERHRLDVLRGLDLLDQPADAEFATIVDATRRILGWQTATIALIDETRQWFLAASGTCSTGSARDVALCAHTVAADDLMVVPDTLADPRFAANPLVVGAPFIRAYLGIPVRAAPRAGEPSVPIGTLCVLHDAPRQPSDDDIALLRRMAALVETLFALRVLSRDSLEAALVRQESLATAHRMQRQLQQAERMANIGSWRFDLRTDTVEWSDQTYALHGLSPDDGHSVTLETAIDFYPEPDRSRLQETLAHTIATGEPYDIEVDFIDARAQQRRIRGMGAVESVDGQAVAIVGVIHDVTDRYRVEQSLRETAQTDELTQVASRRGMNRHLDAAIEAARGDGTPLAVALLDLDRFKDVNDRLGHACGDDVLRVIARRLRTVPYLADCFVARLGGDEFVLLLRGDDADANLVAVARRLLGDLRHRVGAGTDAIEVSATIGLCVLDDRHATRSALLEAADQALYRAKRIKRGTAAIAGRAEMIAAAPRTALRSVA